MYESIIIKFQQILGQDSLITDPEQKKIYETEWRNRYSNRCLAVLFPTTTKQIQQIVVLCQEYKIGIVPQGGNTSLCAGSIPIANIRIQIILNLRKLNKFMDIDIANSSICLDAGYTLYQAQQAANKYGLYLPLSIGAEGSCQIGGNIATNAGGVHVIKYGMMRDLVLGLEAILPDGSIVNQLSSLRKNNANFDLKQLFIGSEGTLGIITKAVLKLFPQILNYVTGLIGVDNLTIATVLLGEIKQKFNLAAFEIINQTTQEIYNTQFPEQKFILSNNWLILFEIEANNMDIAEDLMDIIVQHKLDQVVIASNERERQQLWRMRENIPLAEKMAGFAIKHDISLPISKVPEFIIVNEKHILHNYPDAQIIAFGHLGDGNLHYNIQFVNMSYAELQKIEHEVSQLVYTDVHNFNGSFCAEHGIGYLKKEWFSTYYDPVSYQLASTIKKILDPYNILNPGKIFTNVRE